MRQVALAVAVVLAYLGTVFVGGGAAAQTRAVPVVNATVATVSNVTTPQGIALSADRTRLYVAETTARTTYDPLAKQCKDGSPPSPGSTGAVGVFDTRTRTRIADVRLQAGSPVHVELDTSSGRVYVASSPGGIDAFQGTSQVGSISMGGAPHDLGIDPTNEHAVVTNTFDTSGNPANQTYVSLVDLASGQILNNVNTGSVGPHKAAVDPSRHLVYVSHAVSPVVDVIDTQTGQLLRQFATGLAQGGAYNAIDLARRRLYVVGAMTTNPTSPDALIAIDLATEKPVAGELQLPKGAHGMRVDPVTGLVWVVLGDAGQVAVIDPNTMTERALIPVGHCPYYLDIDPVRRLAYVTNEADNSVTVLDMTKVPASAAQIKASLVGTITPHGKAAKIAALLKKRGYVLSFTALSAGRAVIDWYYLPKGAHLANAKPRPMLAAAGNATFSHSRTLKITIKLTANGKRLLKHAKRLTLTAQGTFIPTGEAAVVATTKFTLTR